MKKAQALNAGEEILVKMRPTWRSFTVFFIGLLLCSVGPFTVENPPLRPTTGLIFGLVFLLVILRRWSNVYTLTNQRLMVSGGLFARDTSEIQLSDISDVQTHQGIVLRLLQAGHILVRSRKPDESSLLMYGLNAPFVFKSQLEKLAGEAQGQPPSETDAEALPDGGTNGS